MCWMLLITVLLALVECQSPVLDGFPVTFSLQGPTSYTPNSGGSLVNGYILTIGYRNHGWLAAEIIGTTNDVVVV